MEVVVGAVLAVVVLTAVLAVVGYLSRLRALSGRVGSFSCGLRGDGAASWTAGIAQYGAHRLEWWRVLSLAVRAERVWSRASLTLLDREPTGETDDRGRALLLVRCEHRGETFELLISEAAAAGLVSWLEAGPRTPGRVT